MIGSVQPWFGAKRTLAPEIVRQLGRHRVYWEPMCGSLAVLMAKPVATCETCNDLHTDLIHLARCLANEDIAVGLYGRLARTLFHEDLLPIAKERLTDSFADPEVLCPDRAYWYLVFGWMHMNGVAGTPLSHTGTFCARYSGKGGNGATRWRSVVDSIPEWHERLRWVQFLCRDAFGILERIDDADGTVLYVDPPYIVKGAKYVHDFASGDHDRLASLLRRFQHARVVVSYYDHPRLESLYPGWLRKRCDVAKSLVLAAKRTKGKQVAPEVMLVNGPLLAVDGTQELELFANA